MILKRHRLKKGTAKDIILDAAETVFAEKGFDGTTIDNIAFQAGVTKKLLYYHFLNKQSILNELFNFHLKDIADKVENFFPTNCETPTEFVTVFVDTLFEFLETKQKIIKVFAMESVKSSNNPMLLKILEPIRLLFVEKMRSFNFVSNDLNAIDLDIKQLFLGLVPIFTYFAFNDCLATYYNIGKDELKIKFTKIFKENMLLEFKGANK